MPALPEHILELGRWVAGYYLAPVGETFRAMLPPAVELRVAREWQITASVAPTCSNCNPSQIAVQRKWTNWRCCNCAKCRARPYAENRYAGCPEGRRRRRGCSARLTCRARNWAAAARAHAKIVAWRTAPGTGPAEQAHAGQARPSQARPDQVQSRISRLPRRLA